MAQVKITLVRSLNSCTKRQLAVVEALGLRKIGHSVIREDSPAVLGSVKKVPHLLSVEKV